MSRVHLTIRCAVAGAVVLLAAAVAICAPPEQKGEDTASANPPAFSRSLLERPEVPVIQPRGGVESAKPRPNLPPEGTMLVNRLARLQWDPASSWFVLRFTDRTGPGPETPFRVLPSRELEEMERLALRAEAVPIFRVTGETTVCEDHAYLLVHRFTVLNERPELGEKPGAEGASGQAEPAPADEEKPERAPGTAPSEATSQPADSAGLDDSADPDAVIRALLRQRPGKSVSLPVRSVTSDTEHRRSVAPAAGGILPAGPGRMAVDRLVRIVKGADGEWWEVRFESDNTGREPPMRLLPCRHLAAAKEAVLHASRNRILQYHVTGMITLYKGRRYLLLRKLLHERRMDQF